MTLLLTVGGIPFVCGGLSEGNYTDSCYKYEAAEDEWQLSGAMEESKGYMGHGSSESLGNPSYMPSLVFWASKPLSRIPKVVQMCMKICGQGFVTRILHHQQYVLT